MLVTWRVLVLGRTEWASRFEKKIRQNFIQMKEIQLGAFPFNDCNLKSFDRRPIFYLNPLKLIRRLAHSFPLSVESYSFNLF